MQSSSKKKIKIKCEKYKTYTDKQFKKDVIDLIKNKLFSKKNKLYFKTIICQVLWLFDSQYDSIISNIDDLFRRHNLLKDYKFIFQNEKRQIIENVISKHIIKMKNNRGNSIFIYDIVKVLFFDCILKNKQNNIPDDIEYPNIFRFFEETIWENIDIHSIIFQFIILMDCIFEKRIKKMIFKIKKDDNLILHRLFGFNNLKTFSYCIFNFLSKYDDDYNLISKINIFIQEHKNIIDDLLFRLKFHPNFVNFYFSMFLEKTEKQECIEEDTISKRFNKICNIPSKSVIRQNILVRALNAPKRCFYMLNVVSTQLWLNWKLKNFYYKFKTTFLK